jgi:mono/diheme cytochrome c family protein
MRNELEIIEQIERYLAGQLSADEKKAFEAELAQDPQLRENLSLQQDILAAIDRTTAQTAIRRARTHWLRARYLTQWGGLALCVLVATTLILILTHRLHPHIPAGTNSLSGTNALPGTNPLSDPSVESYSIDPTKDTVLHTMRGALLNIPRGSLDAGGATTARLEIKEAYSIVEMIKAGLITRSNGQPLSSGGMISIDAAPGENISFKKPIIVSIPTDRLQQGMQLYKGKKDGQGRIDWIDPVPLQDTSRLKDLAIGKSLFVSNCAQCHRPGKTVTGPDLAYIGQRRDRHWLYSFIHNNQKLMASGDCFSIYVFNLYNKTPMNTFPSLDNAEIDQIVAYIDNESRLIDSNTIPDYKKQYDSCVLYNRLADSLIERRAELISDNGQRTDVIRGDKPRKPYTGTYIAPPGNASVDVVEHPAIYYKFTVEAFGWYNVDALVNYIPEAKESELRVHVPREYSGEINVFFVMPGRKILCDGGLLAHKTDEFGFLTKDGKIPLPQGEQGYVFATGEYKGKPVFGVLGFITGPKQSLDLKIDTMTIEKMNAAIARLDFNHLSITAADSKNAAQIRATDTTLAAIARFKPKHCDCSCGVESENMGTIQVGAIDSPRAN